MDIKEIQKLSGALLHFMLSSSDTDLSDTILFFDRHCFAEHPIGTPCWKIKDCKLPECKLYGKEAVRGNKCWIDEDSACCKMTKNYADRIQSCINCDVFKQNKNHPVQELTEVISMFIKFMQSRERYLFNEAVRDKLTGAYNRTYYEEFVKNQLAMAERYKEFISIILIDLDDFKAVNDTFGHDVGDIVLKESVTIIKKVTRNTDLVFRYGGDEFLVFLPRTNCDAVKIIKLRIMEESMNFNRAMSSKYKGIKLSMSIGCSTWKPGDDIQDKIKDADTDMYTNKK